MTTTNKKLRVLAIHGYRQTDAIFSAKLGSLRKYFKQKINFVFVQAPHKVPPLESSDNDEEPSDIDVRGWWFNTEDHVFKATEPSNLSVGFEESLAVIENVFKNDGPFDGVIGFSQGASFISILCAMQQMKQSESIKFDFAVLISGFKSLCQPHAKFYNEKISIPTLHIYGNSDRIIPEEMMKHLADLFIDSKIIVHDGGHYAPSKKLYYDEFFNEIYNAKFS
ncbi:hypothetical protein PV327_010468 [Microctonus hyperodae]|uniref:Serine hydrolase domain-containing protein n=1 Tax=Microctonus hyperodae TaxID=165561 RepID=A0AA39KV14_MICHY|nr:hypothetical protein PV327_010468 [Microctonus hyperodae]